MSTEKTDVELQMVSPLCTYGRDEEYIMNKFWLAGISSVILYGVGDGMIAWVCLQMRIPCMCLYDKQLHQKTIEDFLLSKVIQKMEDATPDDTRWWRSNVLLGCRNEADSKAAVVKPKTAVPKTKAAGKAPGDKDSWRQAGHQAKKKKGNKASGSGEEVASSSSSSSAASSSSKRQKTEEAKKKDE